jgi:hypothetical protein
MDINSQEIIFNRTNAHEDFYGCGGGAGSEFDSEENNLHLNIASHLHDAEEDDDEEDDVDYCPSGPAAIAATNAFKQRLISTRLGLNNQTQNKQTAKPPVAAAANNKCFDDFIMKANAVN